MIEIPGSSGDAAGICVSSSAFALDFAAAAPERGDSSFFAFGGSPDGYCAR